MEAMFVSMVTVLLMLTLGMNGGEASDSACSSVGGYCKSSLGSCSGGSFRSGLCSGWLRKCCVPRTQPGAIKSACSDRNGHVKFYIQRGRSVGYSYYTVSTVRNIPKSYLDGGRIHIVIHGWNMRANEMKDLGYALYKNNKGPVIVVDWSVWSGNNNIVYYSIACEKTTQVGNVVAQFMYELEKRGYKRSNMHLIGFDLGGKVSAQAGDCLGGQVGRITGLDATPYCFNRVLKHPYLDPDDAQFVDTIRTTDVTGIWFQQQGHADFFVGCLHMWCKCFKRAAPFTVKGRYAEAMNLFKNSITTRSCQIRVSTSCTCPVPICTSSSNTMGYYASKPSGKRKYPVSMSGKKYCEN